MFVTIVSTRGVFQHLKVFSKQSDAVNFAKQCARDGNDAHVHDVPGGDPGGAKAALEMGEGRLIAAYSGQPTAQEIAAEEKRERQVQRQQARREAAAWRTVRNLLDEHNALIDRGEPGVKNIGGESTTTQLDLPEGVLERQKLIDRVLSAKKPDIVRRFHEAMTEIVAEERAGNVARQVVTAARR